MKNDLHNYLSQDYTINRDVVNFSRFYDTINFNTHRVERKYLFYNFNNDIIKYLKKIHKNKWFDYYLTYKLYKYEYDQIYNQNDFDYFFKNESALKSRGKQFPAFHPVRHFSP